MATPKDILTYWLDDVGPKGWYTQSDEVDDTIRRRFQADWEQAEQLTAGWQDTPDDTLAALILTDQFPRNMFRSDARSFATDPLARQIADGALAKGFDLKTDLPQRQFFYLPFEHSEEIDEQNLSVALFTERMPGEHLHHAQMHRAVIAKFGRFPWRNALLGRDTTPAELRFIEAGGYGALVSGKVSLDDF